MIFSFISCSYFKKTVNILCEFIPQMIFLMSVFGYLCIMIFIKWFSYTAETSWKAPSLITTLIDMFMFGKIDKNSELYPGQVRIQSTNNLCDTCFGYLCFVIFIKFCPGQVRIHFTYDLCNECLWLSLLCDLHQVLSRPG